MYRLKAHKGGVIFPLCGDENKTISERMHQDSYKGVMAIYALAIPKDCKSYVDFVKQMAIKEKNFLKVILQNENK